MAGDFMDLAKDGMQFTLNGFKTSGSFGGGSNYDNVGGGQDYASYQDSSKGASDGGTTEPQYDTL